MEVKESTEINYFKQWIDSKEYTNLATTLEKENYPNLRDVYEISETRARELAELMNLTYLANGAYRGIFELTKDSCIKCVLASCLVGMNQAELNLYTYCKNNKPFLLEYLCPVISTHDYINLVPKCDIYKTISDTELRKILKIFRDNNIELWDADGSSQYAFYNGRFVLCDYADWNFVEGSEEADQAFKEQLETLQINKNNLKKLTDF